MDLWTLVAIFGVIGVPTSRSSPEASSLTADTNNQPSPRKERGLCFIWSSEAGRNFPRFSSFLTIFHTLKPTYMPQ